MRLDANKLPKRDNRIKRRLFISALPPTSVVEAEDKKGLLNRVKEAYFVVKAQKGCEESLNLLLKKNTGLVHSIVKRYDIPAGLEYDDLVQQGMCGLWEAIGKYNPKYNTRLCTYAYFWITKRVSEAVNQKPKGASSGQVTYSLDTPLSEGEGETHLSLLRCSDQDPEESYLEQEERAVVREVVLAAAGSPRGKRAEEDVALASRRLLAENPATLHEMAVYLDFSREGVRQREKKLLLNISKRMKKHKALAR